MDPRRENVGKPDGRYKPAHLSVIFWGALQHRHKAIHEPYPSTLPARAIAQTVSHLLWRPIRARVRDGDQGSYSCCCVRFISHLGRRSIWWRPESAHPGVAYDFATVCQHASVRSYRLARMAYSPPAARFLISVVPTFEETLFRISKGAIALLCAPACLLTSSTNLPI